MFSLNVTILIELWYIEDLRKSSEICKIGQSPNAPISLSSCSDNPRATVCHRYNTFSR